MKLGFDKSKVTCFRCKQKGHFKRECTNQGVDESVNPFHDDYYKKAIYHRTNEQPPKMNQKQIGEGSSKEKKQALVVIQDDEGFNWNKYIPKEKMAGQIIM
ncbi:putative transcription factor interactor and regulator CCHC(Zn) family [Helianthus anomalus]